VDGTTSVEQTIGGSSNLVTGTGDIRIGKLFLGQLPPAETKARHQLGQLREMVRRQWIAGGRAGARDATSAIELDTEAVADAVYQPWMEVGLPRAPAALPTVTREPVINIFDQANRALLVLGAAGSGKSFAMFHLAGSLVWRSERDPAEPVPVIFQLASWSGISGSGIGFCDWLVGELLHKYRVPAKTGRHFLEEQRLAILLDGLDEVADPRRRACVAAINGFLRETGAAGGIAVSSRLDEYMAQPERLTFGGAVRLAPLSGEQVDAVLVAGGHRVDGLRVAIARSPALTELASSPLFLTTMMTAYENETEAAVLAGQRDRAPDVGARNVLAGYVDHKLAGRAGVLRGTTNDRIAGFLGCIARRLLADGERVVRTEALQPSWLSGGRGLLAYVLLSRAAIGVALALFEVLHLSVFKFSGSPLLQWLPAGWGFVPATVLLGAALGVTVGAVDHVRLRAASARPPDSVVHTVGKVGVYWVLFCAFAKLLGVSIQLLPLGALWAVIFALRGRAIGPRNDVAPVTGLGWSWRRGLRGGALGLFVGGAAWGVWSLVWRSVWLSGLLFNTVGPAFLAIFGLVVGGFVRTVGDSATLGRGLRPTLRVALKGGAVAAAAAFIISLVPSIVASVLLAVRAKGADVWPRAHVVLWALAGIAAIGLHGGMLAALWYGLADALQHTELRVVLWLGGVMPLRLTRFLDGCARLVLLQRAGGGYQFLHGTFLEHFAGAATGATFVPSAAPSEAGPAPVRRPATTRVEVLLLAAIAIAASGALVGGQAWTRPLPLSTIEAEGPRACAEADRTVCSRYADLLNERCEWLDASSCSNLGRVFDAGHGIDQDGKRATALFDKGCKLGDAYGCALLGYGYWFGDNGLPPRQDLALELFERGCDGGSGLGCSGVGTVYNEAPGVKRDLKKAMSHLQRGCDLGSPWGCKTLATIYESGDGVPGHVPAEAAALWQKACDLGLQSACGHGAGTPRPAAPR
jgi:hypothetical protein